MNLKNLFLLAALGLAPAAVLAQTSVHDRSINQRKADQQERIGQGVNSGALNARETSHLEHQEAGINREERGMRAQHNGHLTRRDRNTLRRQQNQESRRISRDKHNSQVR